MNSPILLALDTGSPRVSVALRRGDQPLAERLHEGRHASEALLTMIDEVLQEAAVERRELGGILALQGPGSFTGLRIGLATALALSQALRIPTTALPTLRVLASTARAEAGATVVAAVDALRGEWFVQPFIDGTATAEARRQPLASVATLAPTYLVGLGLVGLGLGGVSEALHPLNLQVSEPSCLAAAALKLASRDPPPEPWDSTLLSAPLYLRAPNIRLPTKR